MTLDGQFPTIALNAHCDMGDGPVTKVIKVAGQPLVVLETCDRENKQYRETTLFLSLEQARTLARELNDLIQLNEGEAITTSKGV